MGVLIFLVQVRIFVLTRSSSVYRCRVFSKKGKKVALFSFSATSKRQAHDTSLSDEDEDDEEMVEADCDEVQ